MKVYTNTEGKGLNRPIVALQGKSLVAVDSNGEWVANLFSFRTMVACQSAEPLLEKNGYDTSFAEWGKYGEMIKLLEDFE